MRKKSNQKTGGLGQLGLGNYTFEDLGFVNHKNPNERDYMTKALIGDKRQGKSTLLRLYAEMYWRRAFEIWKESKGKIKHPSKILIIDAGDSDAFKLEDTGEKIYTQLTLRDVATGKANKLMTQGEKGIFILKSDAANADNDLQIVLKYWRNGFLIIDEFRKWLKSSKNEAYIEDMITKHANWKIDLMLVIHNFMDIPISVRPHIWVYMMFKTPEKPTSWKWFANRRFPNPQQLYETWRNAELKQHYDDRILQEFTIFRKTFESTIKE